MSDIPVLSQKELIRLLKQMGYILDRSKGSHQVFYHPTSKKRVIVPMHNKDLPKGTFYAILKQAGMDKNEL